MTGSGGIRRILMTTDAVGGVWTYALDLARCLAATEGVETVLAVLGPPPGEGQTADARAIGGLTLLPTGLPLDWMADSPAAVEMAGEALAGLAAEAAADLVHLNAPGLGAPDGFAVPVVGVCHSCVATWWRALRPDPLPADLLWRTALVARGYAAAEMLVAPTSAFAHATALTYRLARPPTVVHNGRSQSAPQESGAAPHGDLVFTAGRLWDEGKNLAVLDRAAARLPVPVIAAGATEGPNGARIALRHIQPLGQIGAYEVARWLALGPIFASPARYEPFGLAVLEAAQAGCALVLADIPSLRELWDGVADFVPPDDEVALADAVLRILKGTGRRAALGAAARERAGRYGVEAMTRGMLEVYRGALSGRHGRAVAHGGQAA